MSDLSFFPELREDELLYSALARWCRYAAAPDDASVQRALFGVRTAIATVDLPNRLDEFCARIPRAAGLDVEGIAWRNTLLPYHVAFAQPDRAGRALEAMAASDRDVHLSLGIVTSRVPRIRHLRYCRSCNREMIENTGELWWRRLFQLPGVLVCPRHRDPLHESLVDLNRTSRHHYAAPTLSSCPVDAEACCTPSEGQNALLLSIANASKDLLERQALPANDLDSHRERYIELCIRAGLMRSPKKADLAALEAAFSAHWKSIRDLIPELLLEPGDWLATLVRKQRKSSHPLQHILLELALKAQQQVVQDEDPLFGHGPWPCLNPIADHHEDAIVTALHVYPDHGKMVGQFSCSCGYVYTRGISRDGELGPPRYRSYGPLLGPRLKALHEQGTGLRAMGRLVGLDPKTVARELSLAGIDHGSVMTDKWRSKEAAALSEAARRPKPKVKSKARTGEPRRDWAALDDELNSRVASAARQVDALIPPKRRTFAQIERELAGRDYVRNRIAKLPKTAQAIAAHAETEDAFRMRRYRHWRDELTSKGLPLRPWDIAKRLAITPAELNALLARSSAGTSTFSSKSDYA